MAKKKKSGKKGMGAGFYITLFVLVVVPVVGILGWYALEVSKTEKAAKSMFEKAQASLAEQISKRASKEGFRTDDFNECENLSAHFKTGFGYDLSDSKRRQLLGLSTDATEEEERERCVVFAKVVAKMERLAHHDRHLFVCQGAEFSAENGAYKLRPDANGRGVIEIDTGKEKLIPIQKYSSLLLEVWQIFNLGDGCLVVGMSKSVGIQYSGKVQGIE